MYGKDDVIDALGKLGHVVNVSEAPLYYENNPDELRKRLKNEMWQGYDAAFSSNYYSLVSECCMEFGIQYVSWTYDSPRIALYDATANNSCNYIFVFDSFEAERLRDLGVNAYYMPLAVNPERLDRIHISSKDGELFSADVGMVASLYNEEHNLYDRMEPKLSEYTRGFLRGVMNGQANLFGAYVLEDVLGEEKVLKDMRNAMPYKVPEGSMADDVYVYANYFLARKVATIQRLRFIKTISDFFDMKVYTPGDLSSIPNVKHMGTVDYLTDMNKVFRLSKINLNITLPSIRTGMPLRTVDIMGAGGFLLTNYQRDFERHYEPGVDYVYYTSLEEAIDLIDYYIRHDEERQAIARRGCERVRKEYSFENVLGVMLEELS